MTKQTLIFDGHNDVLLRLYKSTSRDPVSDFLEGETTGHIDLKKARAGSLIGVVPSGIWLEFGVARSPGT